MLKEMERESLREAGNVEEGEKGLQRDGMRYVRVEGEDCQRKKKEGEHGSEKEKYVTGTDKKWSGKRGSA